MSGFPSPSSSPGIPTPASAGVANRSWLDRLAAQQVPYLGNLAPPGFEALRVPSSPLAAEFHPQPPHPTVAPPSTGFGTYYLPSQPQPPAQVPGSGPFHGAPPPSVPVCAKLHRVPLAPPGYHWLKLPAAAQENRPQVPFPVVPPSVPYALHPITTGPAPSWGFSLPTGPPIALWCPIDMAWFTASNDSCICPLLPTGEQQTTNWTRRSKTLPPHEWLLRPAGYDVFPASYPPPDCMLCRDIGRFGLVRNGCPLHDLPFAN
jgi:hypothetical protein